MVNSMTGFAALKGAGEGARWSWEVRSVNARGLDIRLRLPEGLEDLEQVVRKTLTDNLARGNVTLGLRLQADAAATATVAVAPAASSTRGRCAASAAKTKPLAAKMAANKPSTSGCITGATALLCSG